MQAFTVDNIKHLANTDVIRRMLIKYFVTKGFAESFDRVMHPALIQDISTVIPVLNSKIEVIPHAVDIDPALGRAVLGWNMFVLGTHRMYLGESYHNNLADLARQIQTGLIQMPLPGAHGTARKQVTPRQIVTFIVRVLGEHAAGYVNIAPVTQPPKQIGASYRNRGGMAAMGSQFYARPMG